jgi:hypothetical protein
VPCSSAPLAVIRRRDGDRVRGIRRDRSSWSGRSVRLRSDEPQQALQPTHARATCLLIVHAYTTVAVLVMEEVGKRLPQT